MDRYEVTFADPGDTFRPGDPAHHDHSFGLNREHFAGLPVRAPGQGADPSERVAWLVYDEGHHDADRNETSLADELDGLLASVDPGRVEALAVTGYGSTNAPRVLAAYADRLPALRSVFLGFTETETWEISWIRQGDITPLLAAYPELERLEVRGSEGLVLRPVAHEHLRVLRFECGGLPGEVVRAVSASTFPALEHLELWLGVEDYGGDATIADLEGVLSGVRLPALRRLGLRDSERQDEVAAAVAAAPVVARLEELSLGMGLLTDRGAEALLSGQPLTHLRVLDLRHHFLRDAMISRMRAALPGIVDLHERRVPEVDDWMYVAVAE
ncbi:STM4015 family protein [Nonomuraea sp. MTCD27]|uniref:STM4015 family protein n=1 Tax=Nonomuraea sp. MTCD27 TaxID=1676747 RepID=UPI0035C26599